MNEKQELGVVDTCTRSVGNASQPTVHVICVRVYKHPARVVPYVPHCRSPVVPYRVFRRSVCATRGTDRLFHALDSNKSGRISFDDFVVGLAVCCRGTLEEKMRFLFGVYDMNEVNLY